MVWSIHLIAGEVRPQPYHPTTSTGRGNTLDIRIDMYSILFCLTYRGKSTFHATTCMYCSDFRESDTTLAGGHVACGTTLHDTGDIGMLVYVYITLTSFATF